LEDVETWQPPGWKDIADGSITYKSYWVQLKFFVLTNGILHRHWESADGRSKIVHIVLPRSRANYMVNHQEVTWVWTRFWIRPGKITTASRQEAMFRSGTCSATPVHPLASVQCRDPFRKDSHRCSRALPTERPRKPIAPDRHGLFYVRRGRKPTPFPNKRLRHWRKR
jgi:hypothetical protein